MAIDMAPEDGINNFHAGTRIKVVGVGGGGGNAVEHMLRSGVTGIDFVFANTDAQDLSKRQDSEVIQLGSSGQGAGSKPEIGRQLTQEAEDTIRSTIDGAHLLFITAGMGGGTGTGGAPVIARIAREMGILTVAVVTKPFEFEGKLRTQHAESGLQELEQNVDALIVVLNEKLLQVYGDDITQDEAYQHADNILKNAMRGISDIINIPGQMNVDFADIKTVMSAPGKALMGVASAEGADRARVAAEQAMACPLLDGVNLTDAKGLLVVISASRKTLKLKESSIVMDILGASASAQTIVKYGTVYDESLGDKLTVTVVVTGLGAAQTASVPLTLLRTGTDNIPFELPVLGGGSMTRSATPNAVPVSAIDSAAIANRGTTGAVGNDNVPAIWRTNRAAASQLGLGNPLAADTKVSAMQAGGVADTDIPAFLRKQAD